MEFMDSLDPAHLTNLMVLFVANMCDCNKSCQQQTSETEKSPSRTEGAPMAFKMTIQHKDSHSHSPSPQTIFILFISAVGLAIATVFECVFDLKSREFGGFKNNFNVLNNEFKLEKSGLNNDCNNGSLCSDTTSPPNNTVFNFESIRAGLFEFNVCGYVLDVMLDENECYYGVNNKLNNEINDIDIINAYYYASSGMFCF